MGSTSVRVGSSIFGARLYPAAAAEGDLAAQLDQARLYSSQFHMHLFTRSRSTILVPDFYVALPYAGQVVEMSLFLFSFGPNPGLNLAFHLLRVKSRSSKQYLHLICSNLVIPRFFSTYGKPVHEVILCLAGILSILLVGKGLGHVRLVTKLEAKVWTKI